MSVIINITHEIGNLTEYTSTTTDGGDLSVAAGAALAGTAYGLSCVLDDANQLVGTKTVTSSTTGKLRARFYLDPNSLTMGNGESFSVWLAASAADNYLCFVDLQRSGTDYKINCYLRDDVPANTGLAAAVTISDAPHYIEVYLIRAATNVSSDGSLQMWIDGVDAGAVTGKDNYDRFNSFAISRFGAGVYSAIDAGTSGTFYLDEIVINDDGGAIGPVAGATTYTETGAALSALTATGTDVSTFNESGRSAASAILSGVVEHVFPNGTIYAKTGGAVSALTASGAFGFVQKVISVCSETGGANSSLVSAGADVTTFSESGRGVSSATARGLDATTFTEAGRPIASLTARGADATTFTDSGRGVSSATASGTSSRGVTYVETGGALATLTARGSDSSTFTDAGYGLSGAMISGADSVTFTDAGRGIVGATISSTDAVTFSETGRGIAGGTAGGVSVLVAVGATTYIETGAAIGSLTARGLDSATFTEAGYGLAGVTISGADAVTFSKSGYGLAGATASGTRATGAVVQQQGYALDSVVWQVSSAQSNVLATLDDTSVVTTLFSEVSRL